MPYTQSGNTINAAVVDPDTFAPLFERGPKPVTGGSATEPFTAGWSINTSTGVITFPVTTVFASRDVRVVASNANGPSEPLVFGVAVTATAALANSVLPTFTGANANVGTVWTATAGTWTGGTGTQTTTFRFFRNGTGLGSGFSATATYTIAAADAGATITAQVRRTDSSPTPQVVTVTATGSAVIPASGNPPVVVGSIADVDVVVGATVTRTAAGVFTGTGITYAMTNAPAGWTINSTSGAITSPTTTAFASRTITVTASNAGGSSSVTFSAVVRAGMTNTTLPAFTANNPPGNAVGQDWSVAGGAWTGGVGPYTELRRFLRGGTPIGGGAFAAPATYKLVEADRGLAVTAQVQRTDSTTPTPLAVVVTATGSVTVPAAAGTADYTVSNAAELRTAMVAAAGRAGPMLILLEPGNYGSPTLPANLRKTGLTTDGNGNRVTIRPRYRQTNGTPAAQRTQFLNGTWLPDPLQGLDGWIFDNLWFTDTRKDGFGYPSTDSKSMNLNNPSNLTFRNCRFSGQHRNIATHNVTTNVVVEYNEFTAFGMDSWSFYNTSINCHYKNNWWHDGDIDFSRAREDARHSDASSMQGSNCRNCSWVSNRYDGTKQQGYWQGTFAPNAPIRDGADFQANKHIGITVARNWYAPFHNFNCILIEAWENVLVENNLIRKVMGGGPKLVLENPGCRGIIRNNVLDSAIAYQRGAVPGNFTLTNNVISTTATPPGLPVPDPFGPFAYE